MLPKKLNTWYTPLPPASHPRNIALAWQGGVLAVAVLSNLGNWLHVFPTFGGAVLLASVALRYNNLRREQSLPQFWHTRGGI